MTSRQKALEFVLALAFGEIREKERQERTSTSILQIENLMKLPEEVKSCARHGYRVAKEGVRGTPKKRHETSQTRFSKSII